MYSIGKLEKLYNILVGGETKVDEDDITVKWTVKDKDGVIGELDKKYRRDQAASIKEDMKLLFDKKVGKVEEESSMNETKIENIKAKSYDEMDKKIKSKGFKFVVADSEGAILLKDKEVYKIDFDVDDDENIYIVDFQKLTEESSLYGSKELLNEEEKDKERYQVYKFRGWTFRYDFKDCVIDVLDSEGEDIDSVGLSSKNWKNKTFRNEYLAEYLSDLGEESSVNEEYNPFKDMKKVDKEEKGKKYYSDGKDKYEAPKEGFSSWIAKSGYKCRYDFANNVVQIADKTGDIIYETDLSLDDWCSGPDGWVKSSISDMEDQNDKFVDQYLSRHPELDRKNISTAEIEG